MKTYTLLPARLSLLALLTWTIIASHAAIMTPVSVSGFNRDVVIENTASGPPYTGAALNFNSGENRAYYQTNLPGKTLGLPLAGLFTNANDGTVLQLQSYTANNALI